jgi:hypothetical protein
LGSNIETPMSRYGSGSGRSSAVLSCHSLIITRMAPLPQNDASPCALIALRETPTNLDVRGYAAFLPSSGGPTRDVSHTHGLGGCDTCD